MTNQPVFLLIMSSRNINLVLERTAVHNKPLLFLSNFGELLCTIKRLLWLSLRTFQRHSTVLVWIIFKKVACLWPRFLSRKFMQSSLNYRKRKVLINNSSSSFQEIVNRVPQVSILGPTFFNIHSVVCFIWLKHGELQITDDATLYTADGSCDVINLLEKCVDKL